MSGPLVASRVVVAACADADLGMIVRHARFVCLEPVAILPDRSRVWRLAVMDAPFTGTLDEVIEAAAAYLRRRDQEVAG